MMKITVNNEVEAVRVKLEGRLTGPWVSELETCYRWLTLSALRTPLVFDLDDVEFVDASGKCLLAVMYVRGAQLVANTLTMRELVNDITTSLQSERN